MYGDKWVTKLVEIFRWQSRHLGVTLHPKNFDMSFAIALLFRKLIKTGTSYHQSDSTDSRHRCNWCPQVAPITPVRDYQLIQTEWGRLNVPASTWHGD